MNAWDNIESALSPKPNFPVQMPDGRKDWAEAPRQATLLRLIHRMAPTVSVFPVPNAGKRDPRKAAQEGIASGVFDLLLYAERPLHVAIEMKGYTKSGRPGTLSKSQIDWGNRQVALGWNVACFFCPYAAIEWLRDIGFPINGRIAA